MVINRPITPCSTLRRVPRRDLSLRVKALEDQCIGIRNSLHVPSPRPVGCCAPMPSTVYSTAREPAFSNVSVPLTWSPCLSGSLRPTNMAWNKSGFSSTVCPGLISRPFGTGPHLHHTVRHGHLVDLDARCHVARSPGEPIGCGSGIGNAKISCCGIQRPLAWSASRVDRFRWCQP